MNILFVCTANKDRSRTAEIHFQNKYLQHRFRSAGINTWLCERHGGIAVKKYMLDIGDRIVCMEQVHADWILMNFNKAYSSKIEVLNLGDTENFMSNQLIEMLELKFKMTE